MPYVTDDAAVAGRLAPISEPAGGLRSRMSRRGALGRLLALAAAATAAVALPVPVQAAPLAPVAPIAPALTLAEIDEMVRPTAAAMLRALPTALKRRRQSGSAEPFVELVGSAWQSIFDDLHRRYHPADADEIISEAVALIAEDLKTITATLEQRQAARAAVV